MFAIDSTITLANGVEMPRLGLGVFKAGAGDSTRNAVRRALDVGYRHIDTAAIYRNEEEVGDAIKSWCEEHEVAREEIFVTTKLWNDDHGYDEALEAYATSTAKLGLEYVDLYLLHWPVPGKRLDSWRALERLLEQEKVRAIGVSNFTTRHIEQLLDVCEVKPHINQVELHPYLPQHELVEACRAEGIATSAYSPLIKARKFDDVRLQQVAERLGRSAAQLLIRWSLEQGHISLPKSSNHDRIAQNAQVFDFELDEQAHKVLAALSDDPYRSAWDPTDVV